MSCVGKDSSMSEKQMMVGGGSENMLPNSERGQGARNGHSSALWRTILPASFVGEVRVNASEPVFSIILYIDSNLNPF